MSLNEAERKAALYDTRRKQLRKELDAALDLNAKNYEAARRALHAENPSASYRDLYLAYCAEDQRLEEEFEQKCSDFWKEINGE